MPHIAGWFTRAEQAGGCWHILRGLLGLSEASSFLNEGSMLPGVQPVMGY
jgi:hypothetical protein